MSPAIYIENMLVSPYTIHMIRDVNGAGRVRVVAPSYPTSWINIRPVPVPISVGYISVMRVPAYFVHIRGYPLVPASIYKII